jgi:predicted nucleic acid-binding protein
MQTTSTSTLAESQKIRLANFVKKLMPTEEIFQESLNEAEMIAIAIDMFEPNEKLRSVEDIEDAELEEIIYDVMIFQSVAGTLNDLTPEEIAKFDDAVKRQKYVG